MVKDVLEKTNHFLQSSAWWKTKKYFGNEVIKIGKYTLQKTKIPFTSLFVGYLPRVDVHQVDWNLLVTEAKNANCVYVTVDPINIGKISEPSGIVLENTKAIQNKCTVVIDLRNSKEELLRNMKKSHRYLVRSSLKKGVDVRFDSKGHDLRSFLNLYSSTKDRQGYAGRSEEFIEKVHEYFGDNITIITASFNGEDVVSWFVLTYEGIAYLLYAGSDREKRKVHGTYGIMLETLLHLQKEGVRLFDLYGISDDYKEKKDGYTAYKLGFGGEVIEYADSFNVVINKPLYPIMKTASDLRSKIPILKEL